MDYPVGFRFDPEDEELFYYLRLKRLGGYDSEVNAIIREVNILDYEPWQLPELSVMRSNDPFWFFFYILEYKNKTAIRKTNNGFWKITSTKSEVRSRDTNKEIGIKKILTYYTGRSPHAVKTNWVIHEYQPTAPNFPNQRPHVICRLKENDDETADNSTPDEGELSHQGHFDFGDISVNTSPEDNLLLLSNLEANGWLDYDSPFELESQTVMQQGQNLQFTNGFCNDFNGLQYCADPIEQENEDFVNSLLVSQHGQELETSSLVNGHATTKEYRQMQMVQTSSGTLPTLPSSSRDSFVDSSTNIPYHINCMQLASQEVPLHKSQSTSHNILAERAVPTVFEMQRDFSRKAVIKGRVREPVEQGTAVDLLKKEKSNVVESNKDMKMTQKSDTKKSLKLSLNGPTSTDQKGFFIFRDAPPSSHSSNPPSVYLINTFLGIFLLIVVIRELILFGDWY